MVPNVAIRVLWTSDRRCSNMMAYLFSDGYDESVDVEFRGLRSNIVGLPLFPLKNPR